MLIDRPDIQDGESLHGYLLRLSEANGLGGIRHLLAPTGQPLRATYAPTQLRRVAAELDLDASALANAAPTLSCPAPERNSTYMPALRAAVCPSCLSENAMHRTAWNSVLTPVCARHRALLVDRCPSCREPLTWRRHSVTHCDCGQDLTAVVAPPASPTSLAITCLLLGANDSVKVGALPAPMAALTPEGADDLVWFIACHAADPAAKKPLKRPRPASTAEAVDLYEDHLKPVLADWPKGLHALLGAISASGQADSAGVAQMLGRWYRLLRTRFSQDKYQFLHDEVARYVASTLPVTINGRTTRVPRSLAVMKGWLTVPEAARQVGVNPERLRNALRDGDVPGEVRTGGELRDVYFVRRETVDAIHRQRALYVTAKEAMHILNASKVQLERLVNAGGLARHLPTERPALVDDPFRRDEIEALLLRLEARLSPKEGGPRRQVTLNDVVASRGRGDAFVRRAYRAVVTGDIVPRSVNAAGSGLDRYIFDADEIDATAANDPLDTQITLTQLCEITKWKPEAVSRWIDAGLLRARRQPNGRAQTTWIRLDDLVVFLTMHTVVADLAGACASHSRYVIEGLDAMGCPVRQFENSSGQAFASVVDLSELGRAVLAQRPRGRRSVRPE